MCKSGTLFDGKIFHKRFFCQRPVIKMSMHAMLKFFLKKSKFFEMSKNESPTHKTCSGEYLDIFNFCTHFTFFDNIAHANILRWVSDNVKYHNDNLFET